MADKIVGILGGMGPYATLNFWRQLLDATPAKRDWEHLRVLIDSNVKLPSRTRAVLYDETSPVSGMIDSINNLARAGAEIVAVPCNSAHFFFDDVSPHISIPWVNIIDATASRVRELGMLKPLILGGYVTVSKRLYDRHFRDAAYLVPNNPVSSVIEDIKLHAKPTPDNYGKLVEAVRGSLPSADCIVLACTELAYIAEDIRRATEVTVIDCNFEYAKAVLASAREI